MQTMNFAYCATVETFSQRNWPLLLVQILMAFDIISKFILQNARCRTQLFVRYLRCLRNIFAKPLPKVDISVTQSQTFTKWNSSQMLKSKCVCSKKYFMILFQFPFIKYESNSIDVILRDTFYRFEFHWMRKALVKANWVVILIRNHFK